MSPEIAIAFVIFMLLFVLANANMFYPKPAEPKRVVVATGAEKPGSCGNVWSESAPYKAYDNCMASCGECNAYQTEPVLREMVFFNNLYDKEHSYECDPATMLPFARVYDA